MNTSLIPAAQETKNEAVSLEPMEAGAMEFVNREAMKNPETRSILKAMSMATISVIRFLLHPQKILKVGRVTVVFWSDGSSTAVRCGESEIADDYAAFCAALGKKIFGNNSALKRAFMDAPTEKRDA